ncbi:class I SAM-dependent methyltransferase [Streptococcus suis]|nr:class I SAM-dependent methyltransferase [Streptococcus suis]
MNLIVTTSLRMDSQLVSLAESIAKELPAIYLPRNKQALSRFFTDVDRVLVVYKDRLVLEQVGGQSLFFHPDTAMLRIKAGRDPLLELIGDKPKTILDCTMGLASDSIVMASRGHQVRALESSQLTHFLVSRGLQTFDSGKENINQAMRSIEAIWTDSLPYLKNQADKSVDVIYFDPMFSQEIKESQNLSGLAGLANAAPLSGELLAQAKRVAKEKIILKAHFRDAVFERFGFTRHVRPNQKFHYGEFVLEE